MCIQLSESEVRKEKKLSKLEDVAKELAVEQGSDRAGYTDAKSIFR